MSKNDLNLSQKNTKIEQKKQKLGKNELNLSQKNAPRTIFEAKITTFSI